MSNGCEKRVAYRFLTKEALEKQPRKKWRKKIIYAGVFLDKSSASELKKWWGTLKDEEGETYPLHRDLKIHHMTIKFKPSQDEVEKMKIGEKVSLKVIGFAQNDKVQAVLVDDKEAPSSNKHPHITMAVGEGGNAKDSNSLLAEGSIKVNGPTLSGVIGYFGKGKVYDEIAWEKE